MRSLSRFNFPRAPFTPTTAFPATSVSSRQLYSKRAPSPYSGTGSPVRSGWLRHPLVSVANPERIALAVPDSTRVHCTGRPFFPRRGNPTAPRRNPTASACPPFAHTYNAVFCGGSLRLTKLCSYAGSPHGCAYRVTACAAMVMMQDTSVLKDQFATL